MFRSQFVDMDQRINEVLRQSLQRVMSAPWQAYTSDMLAGRPIPWVLRPGAGRSRRHGRSPRERERRFVVFRPVCLGPRRCDAAELVEGALLVRP